MHNQTVKIGILSDVHAKVEPLYKAMVIFEAVAVDSIVCAGDLVERGHEGDAVVSNIREHNIPTVQGNHDRDAFKLQAAMRRYTRLTGEPAAHPYLLTAETIGFLAGLPLTRHFTWAGVRACLTHGTPWSNIDYLFPSTEAARFRRVADVAAADVVITGHTHTPMKARLGDTWFFNPGSTSQNRYELPSRSCGVLTLPGIQFEVYDIDTGELLPIELIPLDEVPPD